MLLLSLLLLIDVHILRTTSIEYETIPMFDEQHFCDKYF